MPRPRDVKSPSRFTPRAIARLGFGRRRETTPAIVSFRCSAWGGPTDQPEPRRVPFGFVPGATTNQIRLER